MPDRINSCHKDGVKFVLYIQGIINVAVCAYRGCRKSNVNYGDKNSWINRNV